MKSFLLMILIALVEVRANAVVEVEDAPHKSVKYADCGSEAGKVNDVEIIPCDKEPCVLHKGTTPMIKINFTPSRAFTNATVKLLGKFAGEEIPFPLPHPDVCKWPESGISCPVQPGKAVTYTLKLKVLKIYPEFKLEAIIKMFDEKEEVVVCVMVPISIQP